MSILVTGSEGTVGKPLSRVLEQKGNQVIRVDRFHSSTPNFVRADISNYRQIESVFNQFPDIEFVYNLAAEFGRWNGEDFYEDVWNSNVIGLKNIIRLQSRFRFKLIHFSSSEVYGDWTSTMSESVLEENAVIQLNDYALSKWCNEVQIKNSISFDNCETVIVRLFNTYGPGERYHPYRSAICKFIWQALQNKEITLYQNHYRSNTFIDDCINSLVSISKNFKPGRVYNIGNSDLQPMSKVVDLVLKHSGSKSKVKILDTEPHTTHTKIVDNSLAKLELKHTDKVDLEEGIIRTINWMKSELQQSSEFI